MKKLAIVITHPIQYYAPVFKLLHQRQKIGIMVFYTWGEGAMQKFDPGFGKNISWDLPLLEGYPYQWMKNISANPGSHHSKGIDNPDLISQINTWQPDAVLVYGWFYKSHLKTLKYFKGKVPVIFRGDSTLLDDTGGIKSLLRSLFLKRVYRNIDYALYTGSNNKAYFKKFGLKETQLFFAPHAVDNARFAVDRADEASVLRNQLGIANDEKLLLFAGKFENKKDPLLLLEAFTDVNLPDTHLLFAGNGILEIELKNKASLHKNVHFIDFQNQLYMPVVYQACDIFCLPSKGPGETWGLAVNEAMACSKAILISNKVGAGSDLVKDHENGMIFNAGDLTDLKSTLKTLLLYNKTALFTMGHQSGKIIEGWSFDKQVEAIEQLINKCSKANR
ncbi:Glycosyltransferase involved in cell wall bisynthesis [Mucilaginibacter gossypiicola]|uniref:Glycosyltransferase involved in cell wall bisynthesis n=1 Tax=Mucilaginibacter gossypiicola TaxID=551995 RepID=A0A1H8N125_9SPHI|nr:glycosyltransferase family 4 protein [Mucilaginibacter gossypiicola]SEO23335.1 Glycosyltransferase involved in cell wall bisynthesis [Mucilaginibacter gossypiicola]